MGTHPYTCSWYKGIVTAFIFAITLYASSQDLRQRITLIADEVPLEQLLSEIEQKSDIYFSYNPRSIPVRMLVSIEARDKELDHILRKIFRKTVIRYRQVGQHVVLTTGDEMPADSMAYSKSHFTISGYLRDQRSGEVLIGAHVYETESWEGTTSNAYGFYSLTLPAGYHKLRFSFMGYEEKETELHFDHDRAFDLEMKEAMLTMQEVEIVGRTENPYFLNAQISEFRFNNNTLSQIPGIAGDKDIIRSLQVVPGIETFGDGSSLFYVRGGSSDQNLILLDEVPMYNTSHLFGFLSVISPDAINDIEVYKGDFAARYGGRISSVVDIKTKDGNNRRLGFGGNVGPYTSSLYLEGPVVKEKSSFYVGGRLSTLQWLPKLYYPEQDIRVGFFDLNAKLNFRINDKNRLFATFYLGNDLLERTTSASIDTYGLGWNNLLGTLRWNHVFSKKLFSNTTAYVTRYQYLMYLSDDRKEYWNSSIANITLKTDFTWFLNPRNTLTAGAGISAHTLDAGNINLNDNTASDPRDVPEYHNAEYTFYLGNDQRITDKLILRYGIRVPLWQNLGPTTVYYFDDNHEVIDTFNADSRAVYHSFASIEPRINLSWLINSGSSMKAGYSRTTQYLNELNNSISPFTSLSVWVPAGPTIAPREANQYSLGYFTALFRNRMKFSAETYYRHYENYIDYTPHANMFYNPLIEGEVRQGIAWSYGLELMLQKTTGKLNGWVGYTYSRVFAKIPGVNNGIAYPAFHDRPHHVTLFFSYNTEKRWQFSANWTLMSGSAVTTPESFYIYNGYVVPVYGEKNNDRLPAYHRLDLSANFRLNRQENTRYKHNLILSIFNVYGRSNPYFISFNRIEDNNGELVVPADHDGIPEIVPTTISVSEIIPSINYQFKF